VDNRGLTTKEGHRTPAVPHSAGVGHPEERPIACPATHPRNVERLRFHREAYLFLSRHSVMEITGETIRMSYAAGWQARWIVYLPPTRRSGRMPCRYFVADAPTNPLSTLAAGRRHWLFFP
jgi:hypothetical protein